MAFNPEEHMIDLKGKKYLQVMWRLVWFREDHPDWGIVTALVSHDAANGAAVFCAQITEDGAVRSTGYGSETRRDFGDYLEKAETKAVGRALAMLGYGTQFAPELDEGERIVDSPVTRKTEPKQKAKVTRIDTPITCERCGCEIVDKTIGGTVYTARSIIDESKKRHDGAIYCSECMRAMKAAVKRAE